MQQAGPSGDVALQAHAMEQDEDDVPEPTAHAGDDGMDAGA